MTITASQTLKRYFGYDSFRDNQADIVDHILEGRDVLAVMPTGAGKSICYQVPALMLDGWTLVISPLISLMKDQVNALSQSGVSAALLNSSISASDQARVIAQARSEKLRLVYVAPERLEDPRFLEFATAQPPALLAIDEAHCVSKWGHDFRPSYQAIDVFIGRLPRRPRIAAFTATATHAVRADILASLGLRDPYTVVASFDRPNLHFSVQHPRDKNAAARTFIGERKGQSGIIYCTTRKSVEDVCSRLQDRGIAATRYHAGLSPDERTRNQDDFLYDRCPVMVATNAFGMGIDKSNVSFVLHYQMPQDLESYYQEAGRAGRDGEPAECCLFYAPADVQLATFLMEKGIESTPDLDPAARDELIARGAQRIKQMTFYCTTTDCLRSSILSYFDQKAPGYCGNCSNCETNFTQVDATVDAQKILSCVYRLHERGRSVGKSTIADILHGSKAEKMTTNGFTTLSTYGIMADTSLHRIRFLMDHLESLEALVCSQGQYPVVDLGPAARPLLKGEQQLLIKVPADKPVTSDFGEDGEGVDADGAVGGRSRKGKRGRKRGSGGAGSGRSAGSGRGAGSGGAGSGRGAGSGYGSGDSYGDFDESSVDPELMEALRDLRTQLASEASVPAYIVFSNHTLADMCRLMPANLDEMLDVSGVGQAKADRYGAAFLEVLDRFRR